MNAGIAQRKSKCLLSTGPRYRNSLPARNPYSLGLQQGYESPFFIGVNITASMRDTPFERMICAHENFVL